jgi:protein-glutamine gamma-glutamyltransferase
MARPVEQFFQVSLLGLLVSGFLALAFSGYLDLPTIVLTSLGFTGRAVAVFGRKSYWQLPPPIANALTLAYIGFYPLDYMYLSREFIPATVHLICFLAVIRVLSAQTNRDYFFVKVLAFLELVAATLLSSNISFFFFLITFVIFGVATFCCSEIRRSSQQRVRIAMPQRNFHVRLAALTSVMTLGIVLMTAGLFIMLPRTARAAFRSLVPQKYHITGFSNEISLGQIGQIQQSTAPVMHILIEDSDRRLPLKWRGGTLSQFDGRRWYNPTAKNSPLRVEEGVVILADDDQRRRKGDRLNYYVRMDAIEADALFFPGIPEVLHIKLPYVYRTSGGAYRTGLGLGASSRYFATSFRPETETEASPVKPLAEDAEIEHLLLPMVDRRIIDLARSLDPGGATTGRARVFERYLRTNFSYTTDLLDQEVSDPLAHFMFDRRAGHCEYFASAMAVMLRAVHIPSRVVTGFQSGVYNPMTGWHVLRASDAHSWVEAWSPNRGWVTFDPTPPALSPSGKPWSALALYMDAAEMWWQQWVVDYNLEHQLFLASRIERSTREWKGVPAERWMASFGQALTSAAETGKLLAPYAGIAAILAAGCWFLMPWLAEKVRRTYYARRIRQRGVGASDAALLYARMLAILRTRGYEKPGWLTPAEFARVIPEPRTADLVHRFTAAYQELRYGRSKAAGETMLGLLHEIEQAKP